MATNKDFKVKNGLIISGDIQQDNAQYLKSKLANGTATRTFGINAANTMYFGSIDIATGGDWLFVNGVERMRITASGDVGIGTGSPGSKLDVGGVISGSNFVIQNNLSTAAGTFGFTSNGPGIEFWGSTSVNPGVMIYKTSSIERMRIGSAGNVTIQSPSSGTSLIVNANDNALGSTLTLQNLNTGVSAWARLDLVSGTNASFVMFQANSGNGSLQTVGANSLSLGTNNTARLTISSAGDVGIGGTPVTYGAGYTSLVVNGSTVGGVFDSNSAGVRAASMFSTATEARLDAFGSRPWNFYAGGTQRMQISTTGTVLITGEGTTSSLLKIQRTSETGQFTWINMARTDGSRALEMIANTTVAAYGIPANAAGINAQGANGLHFSTADTLRMSIDGSGRVGIGQASPQTALSFANAATVSWGTTNYPYISGDQVANTLVFGTQATERMRIASNGTVTVAGAFNAATKSFLIPHPSKPGMKLRYGSLESPYHGVRLTGNATVVNGICRVFLPEYIRDLVKDDGAQVQITNVRHGKVLWVENINIAENLFDIASETSDRDLQFFWTFTAVRKDVPDMIVEE